MKGRRADAVDVAARALALVAPPFLVGVSTQLFLKPGVMFAVAVGALIAVAVGWGWRVRGAAIRRIGIAKVWDASPERRMDPQRLWEFAQEANSSVVFFGVSAKVLWAGTVNVERALVDLCARGVSVSLYLMHPRSKALERRMNSEGSDLTAAQKDIESTIAMLRRLKTAHPQLTIECHLYSFNPVLWGICSDGQYLVGTFPANSVGRSAVPLQLTATDHGRGLHRLADLYLEELTEFSNRESL